MSSVFQYWNQTIIGSMEALKKFRSYYQCWENNGSRVLEQKRRYLAHFVPKSHHSDDYNLWKCFENEITSSIPWNTAGKGCNGALLSKQRADRTVFSSLFPTLKLLRMFSTHVTSHLVIFWLFPTLITLRDRTFSSRSALASAIFQRIKQGPKRSICGWHAIVALALWKMYVYKVWLYWEA